MNLINKALAAAENDELAADWRKEPAQYAQVIRELVARVAELGGLLSAAQQGVQQIQANCYSNDDGDYWRDCPGDCDFVEGLKVGDTFELQASIRAWSETYRVTKAPDDTSDDYEVELVRSDAPIATHPTTQGMDAATLDALQEAESVLNSINMGKQHKVVQADGDVTYWQREEWCKWAKDEVLPKVTAALAAQEKQGEKQ